MKAVRIVGLLLMIVIGQPAHAASSQVAGRASPDGEEEIQCDLPGKEHIKNTAGRDGAGLCVFSSLEIAGHWQNVTALRGLQKKMKSEPGGGWPEKVDAMLTKYAPQTQYLQYNGADTALLKLALKTGRMPAVTYGYSPRYGGRVAHMVNLVHLTDRWAAILDNNFPGEDRYEWMAPTEFFRRWQMNGGGWAIVLLAPPPPPIPINASQETLAMLPLVLLTSALFQPSWDGQSCGPVGPTNPVPDSFAHHEWRTIPSDANRIYLFKDGRQIGGYDYAEDYYREYDSVTDTWGPPGKPPVEPPALTVQIFGVRRDLLPRLGQGEECYRVNGRRVDSRTAFQTLAQGGTLADDSGKLRLTVVGSESACRQVAQDLDQSPALAGFKDKLLIQCYRPDDWAIEPFKLKDLPATEFYLCIQRPPALDGRGEALHAQTSYRGPEALAVALQEAVRKADPKYQPDKTPDLTKPPAAPATPLGLPSRPVLAGGVLLAVLLMALVWKKFR